MLLLLLPTVVAIPMLDAAMIAIGMVGITMPAFRTTVSATTKHLSLFRRLELQFQSAISASDVLDSAC